MESVMVFKILDILLSQPLHIFVMAIAVAVVTGILKTVFKFIKRSEITYFLPYVLGIVAIVIYSAIMRISFKENIGQILINGVYVALLSSLLYQLYKAIKDIGLKVALKDSKTWKIFEELKTKLSSPLSAVTYAKRITLLDKDDINSMIETLRGSGIGEPQLYSLANDLSIICNNSEKSKKKSSPKEETNYQSEEGKNA